LIRRFGGAVCVTITGKPPMSTDPLRACVVAATVMTTPLGVSFATIQPSLAFDDHVHLPLATTPMAALPPPAGSSTERGVIASVQPLR